MKNPNKCGIDDFCVDCNFIQHLFCLCYVSLRKLGLRLRKRANKRSDAR